MSSIVSGYKNDKDMFIKGAPDRILPKCLKYMTFEGEKSMSESAR